MNHLRDSGIDILGDVAWGTHIAQLYSTKADFDDILPRYIRSGLLNREMCLWIYSQNTSYEEVKKIIGRYVDHVDSYIESGQLMLIPYTEWYIKDRSFCEVRVNRQWNELIRTALKNDFCGLRAVADTYWLEKSDFKAFFEYERSINKIISDLPFIVICLYDLNKADAFEVADVVASHGCVIAGGGTSPVLVKKEVERSNHLAGDISEYDNAITAFFSNISHELKTPLNVILSCLQLMKLQKDQDCREMRDDKYIRIMQRNCYRLLRLVDNLIDITRIDSDFYEIKLQNCNIVELVERITLSVVEYANQMGITLLFDTDTEEKLIACDPNQMERVILNLLSNALKFTGTNGNIWVTVSDQGGKVSISVKDTGVGIPPDKLGTIFDRFRQVDKSFTRRHEGSGIGLTLVKALIEKHNGKISVRSELGKGSEFITELPCVTIPESTSGFRNDMGCCCKSERMDVEFSDIYS